MGLSGQVCVPSRVASFKNESEEFAFYFSFLPITNQNLVDMLNKRTFNFARKF